MIVDDELFNVDALIIILKYKFQIDVDNICIKALSGEEAIELIKKDA